MSGSHLSASERALILAPRGRDAAIAAALLRDAGVEAEPCADLGELVRELQIGAGLVVVADEAVGTSDLKAVAQWVADQPAWSDMPFVLLTQRGGGPERNPTAARLSDVLGAVSFVERPFHPTTLVSVVRNALRARRRQYEARLRLEELHRLNETLEQRVEAEVAERAKTEDALRQAQKMEAVGQLTGGIAHDFNNLLQGIVGSLDLIRKRIAQGRVEDGIRFLDGAMTSANRAAALTHRLLAFSRRQPIAPKPVETNPLVGSMEELLRRTLGAEIELRLELAERAWLTLCDPNQLENAILNLVINARDAMPDGGRLTIRTTSIDLLDPALARHRDLRPGQYTCISVTDTGAGMPPDVVARAFDPFFTTKPLGEGTGLGLSMIYGFARQSEGDCKIDSAVGQGTTVALFLPRYDGEVEAHDADRLQLGEAHRAADGEVVLVVEDEHVVRGLIVDVLGDLGYHAIEASDGPTGLDVLKSSRRIDLLVTDIGLPGLNGRQIADAARVTRPNLKILFMTGYAENAATPHGFLEPGMEMITKPFAMEALASRLRGMIDRKPVS